MVHTKRYWRYRDHSIVHQPRPNTEHNRHPSGFGKFLRLHTADGDANPATIRSYYSNAGKFVAWCAEHGINPATATEDDIAAYRKALVTQYKVGTVAVKPAATWRRLPLPANR
jgi:site-specific recombinase XerD